MRFEFATAGRILFGPGTLREAAEIAGTLGRRPLIVTGRDPDRADPLLVLLRGLAVQATIFPTVREPDVEIVEQGVSLAQAERCDSVIGFGGGAALDAAKAIAILITNNGELMDYLELVGRGRELTMPPVPMVAIPTTAGTGSEVTRNSVIVSPENRVKVSLRSPMMLPRVAVVDPELTYDLPPAVTAATGLDALAQVLEPFVCRKANPSTDGLCQEGMGRVARSLRVAFARGSDAAAREDMAVASLFGGLALANAGLGAVHGIAGPLGGMIRAPHGAVCAALLPHVVAVNLEALRSREPGSESLVRYERAARLLTGDPVAPVEALVEWLRRLTGDLGTPGLTSYGMRQEDIPELVENAARASSMKANPVELTGAELTAIVKAAL